MGSGLFRGLLLGCLGCHGEDSKFEDEFVRELRVGANREKPYYANCENGCEFESKFSGSVGLKVTEIDWHHFLWAETATLNFGLRREDEFERVMHAGFDVD